jgi:hypothetical protein
LQLANLRLYIFVWRSFAQYCTRLQTLSISLFNLPHRVP